MTFMFIIIFISSIVPISWSTLYSYCFTFLYISKNKQKSFESHTFQLVLYQWSEQNVLGIFQYKIRIKISKHCFLLLVGFPTKKSHIFWKPCINFMRFEHRTSSFTPKNSHLDKLKINCNLML